MPRNAKILCASNRRDTCGTETRPAGPLHLQGNCKQINKSSRVFDAKFLQHPLLRGLGVSSSEGEAVAVGVHVLLKKKLYVRVQHYPRRI